MDEELYRKPRPRPSGDLPLFAEAAPDPVPAIHESVESRARAAMHEWRAYLRDRPTEAPDGTHKILRRLPVVPSGGDREPGQGRRRDPDAVPGGASCSVTR
ncbi:hypothetical protein BH23CHL8_BH23CHL8_32100 [soil metagenome]